MTLLLLPLDFGSAVTTQVLSEQMLILIILVILMRKMLVNFVKISAVQEPQSGAAARRSWH
jgi:hypothetical protein